MFNLAPWIVALYFTLGRGETPTPISLKDYDLKILDMNRSCSRIKLPSKPTCTIESEEFNSTKHVVVNLWKSSSRTNLTSAILLTHFNVTTVCYTSFWGNKFNSIEKTEAYIPMETPSYNREKIFQMLGSRRSYEEYDENLYSCAWNSLIRHSSIVRRYERVEVSYTLGGDIKSPSGFNCKISSSELCTNSQGLFLFYLPIKDVSMCPYDILFQSVGSLHTSIKAGTIVLTVHSKKLMFWFKGTSVDNLTPWCTDIRNDHKIYLDESGYIVSWGDLNTDNQNRVKRETGLGEAWEMVTQYELDKQEYLEGTTRAKRESELHSSMFSRGMTELQRDWGVSQLQWALAELTSMIKKDVRALIHEMCLNSRKRWNEIWKDGILQLDNLLSYLTDEPGAQLEVDSDDSISLCIPILAGAKNSISLLSPVEWKNGALVVDLDGKRAYLWPSIGLVRDTPPKKTRNHQRRVHCPLKERMYREYVHNGGILQLFYPQVSPDIGLFTFQPETDVLTRRAL